MYNKQTKSIHLYQQILGWKYKHNRMDITEDVRNRFFFLINTLT